MSPCLKPGAVAGRTNPTPWLRGHRRAERSYPMLKVRTGCGEELPLVQGKEQWLHFAGADVKRYPTPQGKRNPSKTIGIARGHQRADTVKP